MSKFFLQIVSSLLFANSFVLRRCWSLTNKYNISFYVKPYSILVIVILFLTKTSFAQQDSIIYQKNTTAAAQQKLEKAIDASIKKIITTPLTPETEEIWEDAFYNIQLRNYKAPFMLPQIKKAATQLSKLSYGFQYSFFTLCYKRYPIIFFNQAKNIIDTTKNYKLLAICAEYILADENKLNYANNIYKIVQQSYKTNSSTQENPHLLSLTASLTEKLNNKNFTPLKKDVFLKLHYFLQKDYLPYNVVVFSFQRKNRNYPGLVIVRDTSGNFIKNNDGTFFAVPQLARSLNNLPSYLSNGNTPQGIFRMDGFGVSEIGAIGKTENLQLTMPIEDNKKHFLKDSTISDDNWTIKDYTKIFPNKYITNGLLEAYFAGLAGRYEIISHGTTINPNYYKNETYYPLTPTQGCLCTKEIWSAIDGKRIESNQQKLINTVKKAGGANGYLIVLELEDINKPVTIYDILPYLKKANQ